MLEARKKYKFHFEKYKKIVYLAALLKKITSKITSEKGQTLALSVKVNEHQKGPLTDFSRYPLSLTKHHWK